MRVLVRLQPFWPSSMAIGIQGYHASAISGEGLQIAHPPSGRRVRLEQASAGVASEGPKFSEIGLALSAGEC